MKYIHLVIVIMIFFSCSDKDTRKTPNGFEFKVLKKGDQVLPKKGDILIYELYGKDSKDSVWADTYKRGLPERAFTADSSRIESEDGITQMFRMLSKGDSVMFSLPVKKLFQEYARQPIPAEIDTTLTISYFVKVNEVLAEDEFQQYSEKLMQEYLAKQEKFSQEQLGKDTVTIDRFLTEKAIEAEKLPSGIRYVIHEKGTGPSAIAGQKVMVNYDGYLLDGRHFDTNVESLAQKNNLYDSTGAQFGRYQPFEVTIDSTSVIKGWHQALKQMSKGSKATFYIPSPLAYGQQQRSDLIRENTILVFDLEVVDIK